MKPTIILMLIIILVLSGCVGKVSDELKEQCESECKEYDYEYLKVDVITSRSTDNYECYCLDEEQKPKSIGIIKNKFNIMRWIFT